MGKRKSIPKVLSQEVYARDGYKCRQCGRTRDSDQKLKFHIDHVLSVADGGASLLDNLQVLCQNCNCAKGAKLTSQALRQLPNIEYEDVANLHETPWNPVVRTENVTALIASIAQVGILCPLLVAEDGTIGDGARRLTAAKSLGIKKVPIIRRAMSAEDLFQLANISRKLGNKEKGQAVARGYPVEKFPEIRVAYEELVRSVGAERAKSLLDRFSPRIVSQASTIAASLNIGPFYEDQRRVLDWIDAGGTLRSLENLSKAYRNTGDPELLKVGRKALAEMRNLRDPGELGDVLKKGQT